MTLTIILFIFGFYLLMKGADLLVEGSSSIAKRYNVSDLIIGLTLVSFGTSAPELIINIFSSFNGSSEIAIGNVFGSNIANILLILGASGLVSELPVRRNTILSEIPFTLTATFLVGFLANATLFSETSNLSISREDGIILLFFFMLFIAYIVKISKDNNDLIEDIPEKLPINKSILYVVLGIAGLFFGGKWVVDGAIKFATLFGMSESFIGLTIVAIGTSLPELVTSMTAAKKGSTDIAVGNVVGSNIFNLLWILGVSATIKPLPYLLNSNQDVMMMGLACTLLFFSLSIGKKYVIQKTDASLYLLLYVGYIYLLYIRG